MGQQIVNGLFLGSIYALFALGYTLVFGVLDILNLAHAAVFMLACFVALVLALFAAATVLLVALLHEVLALLSRRRWAREMWMWMVALKSPRMTRQKSTRSPRARQPA